VEYAARIPRHARRQPKLPESRNIAISRFDIALNLVIETTADPLEFISGKYNARARNTRATSRPRASVLRFRAASARRFRNSPMSDVGRNAHGCACANAHAQPAEARLAVTTITRFRLRRRKRRGWDQRVHVLISRRPRARRSSLSYAGRKRGTASGYVAACTVSSQIAYESLHLSLLPRARTRATATFLIRGLRRAPPRKSGGTRHEIPLVIGCSYDTLI